MEDLEDKQEDKRFWAQRLRVSDVLQYKINNPGKDIFIHEITTDIFDEKGEEIRYRPIITCSSGLSGSIVLIDEDDNDEVSKIKVLNRDESEEGLYGTKYKLSEIKLGPSGLRISDITCSRDFMFLTATNGTTYSLFAQLRKGGYTNWQEIIDFKVKDEDYQNLPIDFKDEDLQNPKVLSGWPMKNILYVYFQTGVLVCYKVKKEKNKVELRHGQSWVLEAEDKLNIRFVSAPFSNAFVIAASRDKLFLFKKGENPHNQHPVATLGKEDGITPISSITCRNDACILIGNSKCEGFEDNVIWAIPFGSEGGIDIHRKIDLITGQKHGLGNMHFSMFDQRGNLWLTLSSSEKKTQQVFLIAREDWTERFRFGLKILKTIKTKNVSRNIKITDVTADVLSEVPDEEEHFELEHISPEEILVSSSFAGKKRKFVLMKKTDDGKFEVYKKYEVEPECEIYRVKVSGGFAFFTVSFGNDDELYAVPLANLLSGDIEFNMNSEGSIWQKITNLQGNQPRALSGWPDRDILYVGMQGCLAQFTVQKRDNEVHLAQVGIWNVPKDEQVEAISAAYSKPHVIASTINAMYVFDKYGSQDAVQCFESIPQLFPFSGIWCRDDNVLLVAQCQGGLNAFDKMKQAQTFSEVHEDVTQQCRTSWEAFEEMINGIKGFENQAKEVKECYTGIQEQCNNGVRVLKAVTTNCEDGAQAQDMLHRSMMALFRENARGFQTKMKEKLEVVKHEINKMEKVLEEQAKQNQERVDCKKIVRTTSISCEHNVGKESKSRIWAIPLTDKGLDLKNVNEPLVTEAEIGGLKPGSQINKVMVGFDGNLWIGGGSLQILSLEDTSEMGNLEF